MNKHLNHAKIFIRHYLIKVVYYVILNNLTKYLVPYKAVVQQIELRILDEISTGIKTV